MCMLVLDCNYVLVCVVFDKVDHLLLQFMFSFLLFLLMGYREDKKRKQSLDPCFQDFS